MDEELTRLNTSHIGLEATIHQKKEQNTKNSNKIKEIQGKVNEVLQKLKQELREKCPDRLLSSDLSQD